VLSGLARGVDRDYPAAHAQLASRICERGLLVSEYAPGVEPAPWRFPARNRGRCGAERLRSTMRSVLVAEVVKRAAGVVPVWSE
jgi:DNA recombination-mediator protein A